MEMQRVERGESKVDGCLWDVFGLLNRCDRRCYILSLPTLSSLSCFYNDVTWQGYCKLFIFASSRYRAMCNNHVRFVGLFTHVSRQQVSPNFKSQITELQNPKNLI
jgi:hypothetical protein